MTTNHSSQDTLQSILNSYNPFQKPAIVTNQEVWGEGFPDLEILNSHASDTVLSALNQVKLNGRIIPLAITAERGLGKSHIISRLRKQVKREKSALFIYANAVNWKDLNYIQSYFLQTISDSFREIGNQGVTQWQELASLMFNQVTKQNFDPEKILLTFPKWLKKRSDLIDVLTHRMLTLKPHISDPNVIRAIFWTLSTVNAPYAMNWLGGKELSDKKSQQLELPNISADQKRSVDFDHVKQIISLASDYQTLLICFDQLEAPECNKDDTGLMKAQVIATEIVCSLFEMINLHDSSHGVVIITLLFPDTWRHQIKVLPGGIHQRISYNEPISLKPLDSNTTVEIVRLWMCNFYQKNNINLQELGVSDLYPFNEDQLRNFGKEKPIVRKLWNWCCDNFNQIPPENPVKSAFDVEISQNFEDYKYDNKLIAEALLFSFQLLIGETVENVTITEVTEKLKVRGGKDNYINFKIVGIEDNQEVSIGVAVLQNEGGQSLGAGLKRLNDYDTFLLTRGCLVRSPDKKISYHLSKKYLKPLIEEKGGEFVELKDEEIKPLMAIYQVYLGRDQDYQLTQEDIFKFIAEKGQENMLGEYNPLLREILSVPSFQIPDNVMEDEEADNLSSGVTEDTDQNFDSFCENLSEEVLIS